jgi:transposase
MWVPPEDVDPVVLHAPTRKSVAVFGAVRIVDGRFASRWSDIFNAATFETFLTQLVRHKRKGRMMVVVADNARWHHARALQPWLKEHRKVLRLDFLPPYSPDLNPVERVWKLTRRLCTHNRYFPTLDQLVETIATQLHQWNTSNETLRRLCAVT